jgi:hypothetical protein
MYGRSEVLNDLISIREHRCRSLKIREASRLLRLTGFVFPTMRVRNTCNRHP